MIEPPLLSQPPPLMPEPALRATSSPRVASRPRVASGLPRHIASGLASRVASGLPRRVAPLLAAVCLAALAASPAEGQWTNRYPKVDGYGHHVYLEGYELPLVTVGPTDPAPGPDGTRVAFQSRGWIWVLDLASGIARQVTDGGAMDSRPAWSPDGARLAFVRDDGRDTRIVGLDLATGAEEVLADTDALDLDPAFSADGRTLWYASAAAGDVDLWRLDLASGTPTRVTGDRGLELRPQPHPDGRRMVWLAKGGGDRVVFGTPGEGEEAGEPAVISRGAIHSQLRPALSPDGGRVAYNVPVGDGDGWELRMASTAREGNSVLLAGGEGRLPLTPAFSHDGATVWYSEARKDETMALFRVPSAGGEPEEVAIGGWEWSGPTGTLRVRTVGPGGAPVAARLNVLDGAGHPALAGGSQPRFDGQNGAVFWYSPGVVEVTVPAGRASVRAARGIATPEATASATVSPGEVAEVTLALTPVWSAADAGWRSGDHHFHLNYGGPYRLDPEDLILQARGEALDQLTPLVANLHDRFGEQHLWGWHDDDGLPHVRFGQEVRSHFLGHLGLIGTDELFWPWVWGPGYQVYGADDRTNAEVTAFARAQGGMAVYVHPVSGRDPFGGDGSIPTELVADAVLGDMDGIELVCLWSDEIGTAELWYRLLNVGLPVAPTAGTDVMTDFYRTMAVGTTRVWVDTDGSDDWATYMDGLRAGRSVASNGPVLDFAVEGAAPGDAVRPPGGSAAFTLELHTAVPVDRVEVLVNGAVAWSGEAPAAPGSRSYRGSVDVPAGGWVAARAVGPATGGWPAMDSYAFGHTAPVWIGEIGSTDPATARAAAADLLGALDVATQRLRQGYAGEDIPRLEARFREAREVLEGWAGG